MAEENLGQSRTEAPSPRRREEAREQGQVAFSSDLTTGALLFVALVTLALGGQAMASGLMNGIRFDLLNVIASDLDPSSVQDLFLTQLGRGLEIVGVFLGVLVILGVAAPALQVGFHVAPGLIGFDFARLSPAQGWSRLFSGASWVRGAATILKLIAIALVVFWVLRGRFEQVYQLGHGGLADAIRRSWKLVLDIGIAAAVGLVVLGIADYAYQRWRLEKSLMMTRQELKEDLKREEGDPQIKARIRKLQREAARKRMFQDIPKATVIITNPTHLAVALRYDRATMAAPKVVAKGAGFMALRIMEVARRHGVPVVERKSLAQTLYKLAKVGNEIPAAVYYLVAEVLAFVYRMRAAAA